MKDKLHEALEALIKKQESGEYVSSIEFCILLARLTAPMNAMQAADDLARLEAAERERDELKTKLDELRESFKFAVEEDKPEWKRLQRIEGFARGLVEYRRAAGPLNFQLEKADHWIGKMANELLDPKP